MLSYASDVYDADRMSDGVKCDGEEGSAFGRAIRVKEKVVFSWRSL